MLHLKKIPLYLMNDHPNYSKWISLHCTDLNNLATDDPNLEGTSYLTQVLVLIPPENPLLKVQWILH